VLDELECDDGIVGLGVEEAVGVFGGADLALPLIRLLQAAAAVSFSSMASMCAWGKRVWMPRER